jgi:cell division protease FtsH
MILSQICSLFGGRIAEGMTLGPDGITTGASNDIERATKMAKSMVTKWGLSEKLGPLMYAEDDEEVFLGMSAGTARAQVSNETAMKIDVEVRTIIDGCYATAEKILEENKQKLEVMKDALLEYETIDKVQIDEIMAGRKPNPPASWNDKGSDASTKADEVNPSNDNLEAGPIGDPASDH